MNELLQGQAGTALWVIGVLAGTFALEGLASLRRWGPYFTWGVPLTDTPVPLPRPPTGEGAAHGVAWTVALGGRVVFWWADRRRGTVPRGLHGAAWMRIDRAQRVHLDVVWAPWWTGLVACVVLSVVGTLRGEAMLAVPLALLFVGLQLALYARAARPAAAALRQALLDSVDAD